MVLLLKSTLNMGQNVYLVLGSGLTRHIAHSQGIVRRFIAVVLQQHLFYLIILSSMQKRSTNKFNRKQERLLNCYWSTEQKPAFKCY